MTQQLCPLAYNANILQQKKYFPSTLFHFPIIFKLFKFENRYNHSDAGFYRSFKVFVSVTADV